MLLNWPDTKRLCNGQTLWSSVAQKPLDIWGSYKRILRVLMPRHLLKGDDGNTSIISLAVITRHNHD